MWTTPDFHRNQVFKHGLNLQKYRPAKQGQNVESWGNKFTLPLFSLETINKPGGRQNRSMNTIGSEREKIKTSLTSNRWKFCAKQRRRGDGRISWELWCVDFFLSNTYRKFKGNLSWKWATWSLEPGDGRGSRSLPMHLPFIVGTRDPTNLKKSLWSKADLVILLQEHGKLLMSEYLPQAPPFIKWRIKDILVYCSAVVTDVSQELHMRRRITWRRNSKFCDETLG